MSYTEASRHGDDDCDDEDYDSISTDLDFETEVEVDLEAFDYQCITLDDVDRLLLTQNSAGIRTGRNLVCPAADDSRFCGCCFLTSTEFHALNCGHHFCVRCWSTFLEVQIAQGLALGIACMSHECKTLAPIQFVLKLIGSKSATLKCRYLRLCREDWIRTSSQLRFCPGLDCQAVIKVQRIEAKRVECLFCRIQFCCQCGGDYHAPASCGAMKEWERMGENLVGFYMNTNTKMCPKCNVPIEKNGGCNHMRCSRCGFSFCWMCRNDWGSHGYAMCNRYVEKLDSTSEVQERRRDKYLFYSERYDNHARSLRLEASMTEKIRDLIEAKVGAGEGSWIDWQYLLDATTLLHKCRYTLQYTYPYAFSLDYGPRKELFEYQQAALESEIENLSWKLERAETAQRGDIANQMSIAEKRRTALLKDCLNPHFCDNA